MAEIARRFAVDTLPGEPRRKTALLINPPVYDTQYWAEWAQPYGLLRIAALLKKHRYKHIDLFDFMETGEEHKAHFHKINADEDYSVLNFPEKKLRPLHLEKEGQSLNPFKFHFGKPWDVFERWLEERGYTRKHPPTEVWISATMTYWWESARDLIARLRRYFGKRPRIIMGGIYPTLVPDHAARYCQPDIVVAGEVEEANDLWTDLSLYEKPQTYAIITPSRGCPFDCSYCAQKTINGGIRKVRFREPADIIAEMRHKYETYGIRDFAFYADSLLFGFRHNLMKILELIVAEKLPFHLHAPEGLDTKFLSQDERLLPLMKQAGFQKVYLPVENIDDSYLRMLNRKHVRLEHFVKAAELCKKAGFRMRNLEVNAFALYGLPGEKIDHVVKTVLFVSEIVGSIIPMLFTPVPSTVLYLQHLPYLREVMGGDRDLHKINGKLFPFLQMNEGSIEDYIDLQRLMFTLNAHYRSRSFHIFGSTRVSQAFVENIRNGFERFVRSYTEPSFSPFVVATDLTSPALASSLG
jgi:hypothetical protein